MVINFSLPLLDLVFVSISSNLFGIVAYFSYLVFIKRVTKTVFFNVKFSSNGKVQQPLMLDN
jgi:hypothetical protein